MFLKISKLNATLVKEAKSFFDKEFIENLKQEKIDTFEESLVARYFIFKNYNYKFSSISHKKGLVFIGAYDFKIGVDIEIYKERDISLLDKFSDNEYDILGGKNWHNFYILWTSKESIIKFDDGNLDNIQNYKLIGTTNIAEKISEIKFNLELILVFGNKKFKVVLGNNNNLFFSLCF